MYISTLYNLLLPNLLDKELQLYKTLMINVEFSENIDGKTALIRIPKQKILRSLPSSKVTPSPPSFSPYLPWALKATDIF